MELKERIKKTRKAAGFKSQEKLAEYLGTTRDAMATYESGRVVPNDVFLQLMAAKLGISYEWLKSGEGEMKAAPPASALLDDPSLDDADRAIMCAYRDAPPELRDCIKRLILDTAARIRAAQPAAPAAPTEAELAAYERVREWRAAQGAPPMSDSDNAAILTDEEWDLLREHRVKKGSETPDAG